MDALGSLNVLTGTSIELSSFPDCGVKLRMYDVLFSALKLIAALSPPQNELPIIPSSSGFEKSIPETMDE